MKPANKYLVSFLAAASLGVVAGASTDASAWWVRSHASNCMTLGGSAVFDLSFSVQNDSTTSRMVLLCPATDSSSTLKQSTVAMNVHGYDDHSLV